MAVNPMTGEVIYGTGEDPYLQQQINLQNAKNAEMKANVAAGLNPDGSPKRPEFESLIGPDGKLMSQYQLQLQTLDPNSLEGYNMLKQLATQEGPSKYAKLAEQQVGRNLQDTMDAGAMQSAAAQAQARAGLAMRGGLSTGSRERMAQQGAKDLLMSKQGAYRQQGQGLLDILKQDEEMKRNALSQFGTAEANIANKNLDIGNQATQYNIGNLLNEKNLSRQSTMDAYTQELDKWSSGKQAEATRSSGGGGGGGCCFIFLEARYGNGTMDKVVRKFRDEHMTERNRRGYYKLSEVLVPLMRKFSLVKLLVRITMTDPLVAYGKAHYGGNKFGFIFTPVKNFWLKMFDYLGQDHKFIRENGEVI